MAVIFIGRGNQIARRKPDLPQLNKRYHIIDNVVFSTPYHERGINSQLSGYRQIA